MKTKIGRKVLALFTIITFPFLFQGCEKKSSDSGAINGVAALAFASRTYASNASKNGSEGTVQGNPNSGSGTSTLATTASTPQNKILGDIDVNSTFFVPSVNGTYLVALKNGTTQSKAMEKGKVYFFSPGFTSISLNGEIVTFKLLPPANVEIKVYNPQYAQKLALFCGTNNSTDIKSCENANLIKKLIAELTTFGYRIDLYSYTVGSGISEKGEKYKKIILENPSVFNGSYDYVISISQGTSIEMYLEEIGVIKPTYKMHLRAVAPDKGILNIWTNVAVKIQDMLWLLSKEYVDYASPLSTWYSRTGNACDSFKIRTNISTLAMNTLATNGDWLMPNSSHSACANLARYYLYRSLTTSHFNMDNDSFLVPVFLDILFGKMTAKEIQDPRDTGAMTWLSGIQSQAALSQFNFSVGLDGSSLVGELKTQSGTTIASLRIVDLKGTPDLYLGDSKLGEFFLDRNGTVHFIASAINFASMPGLNFTFNMQNKSFVSNNGNDSYSIDLNTMNLSINGNIVGKVTDISNMKIQSIPLGDLKAGNITVKQVQYDLSKNALSGIYKDALFGQEIQVLISFADDKLYLGSLPFGSFSKYINGQLNNFAHQVMNGVPAELKAKLDPLTKGVVINSLTIDPGQRILTHITKDLGNESSIELVLVLGKDSQGIYFKTLENSSFIKIALEPNNHLLLNIRKFEIRGNLGENISGEIEIYGGTRIHKTQRIVSNEARLVGMVLLTWATNPISFGAGIFTAVNSGSDLKQIATGFTAGVLWGAGVGGAIVGPLAAIPALIALYSEVKVDANVNFETELKMKLKDNVFSVPKSKIIGVGGDVNAVWILFGIEQLPNLTIAADAGLDIYLESHNLRKSILLSGNGSLSGTIKFLFADVVSADADLKSFSILMNIGADPAKESKGQISLDAKIRASAFLKIVTITEETLNLTLTHVKADTYSMPIKRTRWDVFSDAKEEGTINFKMTPDRQVSILSSDLKISGRGGTLGECPSTPVTVRGGNNVLIEEGKADCRIEIRINLFGKGDGGWRVATIPTGETKIPSLGIDTLGLKD